ncbi:substrate-binding and vWA domain-containing protein [Roseiflexus castenholzii]|jgi:Ca-activated chloride channel family protein|uniref:von Willebrand factor type A n=1 Tax=Roseiflexus castenholzii (strain DSM 13941 / HLO8) TaxID=383372 RepID=A7NM93_ROSCS|nr:VWA domain-containing protein [Roseiflexus castenholzii]ABU58655.1 von Willebrand factor type A [Roseiflexus castenholzii DSM 13941]
MRHPFRWLLILVLLTPLLAACGAGGGDGGFLGGNTVEVSIAYGSEKRAWLEEAVRQFNAAGRKTASGASIQVVATPMGSTDSMNQILSGAIQPTVWSPASRILLPVANDEWGKRNNGATLVDENAPLLVLSPVVIAMWKPMAEALGWPNKPLGWSDIAELSASGKTWADFGRPEWGPLQFGHTHPDYSNSGVATIIAISYAAAEKTRGLTVADVQNPKTAEFMRNIESGVIHYGESTGFFADQMFNRGPGYLSAAVLYENLVIEAYNRDRYPSVSLPVVAIYPKEGTFWTDHPYAILNAPWVTDEQREAANIFLRYLLDRPQQELALRYGYRPSNTDVAVGAPITPENGVDPQQPQTLLEVPRPDVLSAIRSIWEQNKKRVDVMAVLDVSGSMEDEGRLEQAKAALRIFVEQLQDDDGFGLTIFSDQATVLTPISPIGSRRTEVLNRIAGLTPRGGTRLLDTVVEAYQELTATPPGQRIRAVVVLTDGLDNRSQRSAEDVLDLLRQDREGYSIKVFTIAFGGDADVHLLKEIASATGAKSYVGKPGERGAIERIYQDITTFF